MNVSELQQFLGTTLAPDNWAAMKQYLEEEIKRLSGNMVWTSDVEDLYRYQGQLRNLETILQLPDKIRGQVKELKNNG